jgi:hypothetical protein
MVPVSDEYSVSVANLQSQIPGRARIIKVLKGKAFRTGDPVVVNLVQVNFLWGIVDIVLVGRIARPVSARSVNLHGDQAVGWKLWPDDINDLA